MDTQKYYTLYGIMLARKIDTYYSVLMTTLMDKITYRSLFFAGILLGLAPFFPEPHSVEKMKMLLDGNLVKPIDIFDLVFHTFPILLMIVKILLPFLDKRERGNLSS